MTVNFNPDNVTMQDAKTGSIPTEVSTELIKDVIRESTATKLFTYEPMEKTIKQFPVLLEGPGAYWVSEGEIIETSKPKWATVTMEAKKLGVILPVTKELLEYSVSDFFEIMKPKIAEAFYKKFDDAVLFGINSPYNQSILDSARNSENVIEGEVNFDNLLDLDLLIDDAGAQTDAYITRKTTTKLLRRAKDEFGEGLYDARTQTIEGEPVVFAEKGQLETGEILAGDFKKYARFGIPRTIEYQLTDSAQLSSVLGEDGKPINLFERDMVALRATMYIGFMVIKDDAFALLDGTAEEGTVKP